MLLGTFRFADSGLDYYKPAHPQDMLSPAKQREVAEVLDRLATFAPQRIGVERRRERQPELDAPLPGAPPHTHTLVEVAAHLG